MDETKFTPGPWRTERPDPDCNWLSVIIGDCKPIAEVTYDGLEASNAHLIAAAPELYQALEKAVNYYGRTGGPWNVPSETGTWLAMAQAALQKARGEKK